MTSQTQHIAATSKGCNTNEHKRWNRRSFLQALGLVGGGTIALANSAVSVAKPSPLSAAISAADNDRIMILIRLKGGNDGLNTIIPLYDYDTYANARPTIRIKQNELFKLNDDFGMATYASQLEKLWKDGQMKVVHGVGYEDSSLSHFDGSDIWATTDVDNEIRSGWMGRYFQELYPDYLTNPPEKPTAIQIGNNGNLIFNAQDNNYAFAVADPKKLYEIAKNGELYDLNDLPDCTYGEKVGYLKGVANTTFAYAGVINEAFEKSRDFGGYPENKLANQLSIIARLIKGNLGTKVYMVELSGFDTHDDQRNRQQELISDLADTVAHFYKDLNSAGWDENVLAMTLSEFGRRVAENGSAGTDHGTASQTLLFGPALEGNGFIGAHPDLSDLDRIGNLKPNTDFRQLYATLLKEWMCVNPSLVDEVLLGQDFEAISIGFGCNTLATTDVSVSVSTFRHVITYEGDRTFLNLTADTTSHIDIALYNILGQKVATLKNELLLEGDHKIDIKTEAKTFLDTGQYVYRISTGRQTFSNQLIIM